MKRRRKSERDRLKATASPAERKKAMLAWIGTRRDWPAGLDTDAYIRDLRRDCRLERLWK